MRTKLTRVGILFAALLGLLATSIPSAQATTIASATFTGTATVPGGLGYPCTDGNIPPGTPEKPCPPTVPSSKAEGNTRDFGFSSDTCVGVKQDIDKPDKGTGTYGPNCVITAAGTLTGYCGLSLGTGLATINYSGNPPKTVKVDFKFTSVGGLILIEGTSNKGPVTAVVVAVPDPLDPAGGTCTNKTATRFLIAGDAAGASITP